MRNHLAFQLALAGMMLVPGATFAASKTAPEPTIQPQVVRLSLVDGDVRIARDQQQGQAKNADWEKAVSGLPLESGFSVATGAGRAVIELQDASTVYLGPNSVLVLNDLTTFGTTPNTEMALLTGTATLHVHPIFAGEHFVLRAPTDTMVVPYPNRNDVRVSAYMDALAITVLSSETVMPGHSGMLIADAGQTTYYRAGKPVKVTEKGDEAAMKEWDNWVADQYAQRVAAYTTVMKETGLKTLVPGLDSLKGQGKFVDCGQYGKCWEPPAPTDAELQGQGQAQAKGKEGAAALTASTDSTSGSSTQPTVIRRTSVAPRTTTAGSIGMGLNSYFPCGPDSFYYRSMMYQNGGMMPMGAYGVYGGMGAYGGMYSPMMWNWAVCHTGSWIMQDNRYLWVPGSGNQIQYQPPVLWVKSGGRQGYVPLHPLDVAGQTPNNLGNGIIVRGKNSLIEEPIKVDGVGSVKVLHSAPRGAREGYSISLARSDSPRIEGRILGAEAGQKAIVTGNARSVAISFDHGSQSFMVSRPVGGSSTRTVNEPVGNFLVRSGVGGFGGPTAFRPSAGAGMNGSERAMGAARAGEFRGGAVFNGGAQRGGGDMNAGFGGNPRMSASSPNGGGYNPGGGNMGGGNMGGGGGAPSGGGGGGFGGGPGGGGMGGGGMGGGRVGGSAPAPAPSR